jgi:two-component system LytT family response regulator
MSAFRAVIVDDMAPARAKLRRYLADDPRVTVVGEASSCRQAALLIADQQPQIAFVDIHMPDGNGMDLLENRSTCEASQHFCDRIRSTRAASL